MIRLFAYYYSFNTEEKLLAYSALPLLLWFNDSLPLKANTIAGWCWMALL